MVNSENGRWVTDVDSPSSSDLFREEKRKKEKGKEV